MRRTRAAIRGRREPAAARGSAPRWRRGRQVRQADPSRRPPWHPVRLVPRLLTALGQGHPLRRAARRRPRRPGARPPTTGIRPSPWTPAQLMTLRPPRGVFVVIRTHEAGTLRAEDARHEVVLAGWVARRRDHGGVAFLDLRDASGSSRSWSATPRSPHELRAEYCMQGGRARSLAAPRATRTPSCPPARSR